MTTYRGPDSHHPDIESSPGNTVVVEDVECQKRVRVTFATLNLHNPSADDAGRRDPGPLAGTFSVTAGPNMESVNFHAVHCLPFIFPPFERCWGYRLNEGEHSIQNIFDGARAAHEACGDRRVCHGRHYGASPSDTVTIAVNPGDDLTIAARITDADEGNPDDLLFHERAVIDTSALSPDSIYTLVIPGEQVDLKVLIDLFPFDP